MSNVAESKPAHLYKFRSLSGDGLGYVSASLLRREFLFSTPASFNDPFDCLPVFSLETSEDELVAHFDKLLVDDPDRERKVNSFRIIRSHPEILDRNVEAMNQQLAWDFTHDVGVLSLSAVNDDILMWSHYADCHRKEADRPRAYRARTEASPLDRAIFHGATQPSLY